MGTRIYGGSKCILVRVEENSRLVIVAGTAIRDKGENVGSNRAV